MGLPPELAVLTSSNHASALKQLRNGWQTKPGELQSYRKLFEDLDVHGNGYLDFNDVKTVFERSTLPQDELSQIWQLSDVDEDGKLTLNEFSCAVHLIQHRRQGAPLPSHRSPQIFQFFHH